jgi:transposase
MRRERRDFDKEFKMMAVNLCYTGKPTKEVAEELGIRSELVRRWKREYEVYSGGSFSGHGNANMTKEEKEIARLRRELKEAQIERDILKKAISIFSKGDNRYSTS